MQTNARASAQSASLIVGVDVGGTKIAAGVVDGQGRVCGHARLPTVTSRAETVLQSIAAAITAAIEAAGVSSGDIRGVGLGVPGKVDAERGIGLLAVNLGWRDVPVKRWLEDAFGLPCAVENDVSAAALGEHLYGVGRGLANLVYLSLGTGIAARVIIEGRLYRGTNGMAGELGHAVFVEGGPRCRCGAYGCLEALAAGPAIARNAQQAIGDGQVSLLREQGLPLTAELVFAAAAQGDKLAQQVIDEAASHLAYAIYLLAMSFDPQIVVLGGGMAQNEGPLSTAIRSGLVRWSEQSPIFREILTPETVQISGLKQDAGILGAAALVAG